MVVFTCQHCGDPVKKSAVEKHYNTKCRFKSPYLTCVDCLKDFSDKDYNNHNQCMTEEQRYSAVGTVFKEQKGKKKQEQYLEIIQNILNSDDLKLSSEQRELLQICSNHDNVPRKLKPFQNFMKNVTRGKCQEDVTIIFNVIENAWKKGVTQSSSAVEKKTTGTQEPIKNDVETKKIDDEGISGDKIKSDSGEKIKKKKRSSSFLDHQENCEVTEEVCGAAGERLSVDSNNIKSKKAKKKMLNNNQPNDENEEALDGMEGKLNKESKKKEKQKRKSQCLDSENVLELEDGGKFTNDSVEATSDDIKENVSNKSKKLLKKQKKYEKYLAEIENEGKLKVDDSVDQECNEDSNDLKKNKKKTKKLKSKENEMNSDCFSVDKNAENTIDCSLKTDNKKVKKRKLEETIVEIPEKKVKEDSQEGSEVSAVAVFDWADVIVRVLTSRPDKELSLKKLCKKVINEYQSVKQDHRTYEDLLAKFNKKVNKVKGVRVLKDRATLIE